MENPANSDNAVDHRSGSPDIMNDPEYQTNTTTHSKSPEDGDTCRICRGEATEDEPLFYPCKCSGSIKFVHQECLMEWLSHSQKKYCELCKTPFRFTKLYHPHMPSALPTPIFIRRALIHVFSHLLTWCRAILVGMVWLFLLPYCMRLVWRGLFWVGDGGWTRAMRAASTAQQARGNLTAEVENLMTSLSSALNTTSGSQTETSSRGNTTTFGLLMKILTNNGLYSQSTSNLPTNTTIQGNTTIPEIQYSTLLSNVQFLQTFSTSPDFNRFVMDVLEGQFITFVVVVAFILIFLIREWVVQQQPMINLAALNGPDARQQAPQVAEVAQDPEEANPANDDVEPMHQDELIDQDHIEEHADESDVENDGSRRNSMILDEQGQLEEPPTRLGLEEVREAAANNPAFDVALKITETLPTEIQNALLSGDSSEISHLIETMPPEEASRLREQIIQVTRNIREQQKALQPETEDSGSGASSGSDGPLLLPASPVGPPEETQHEDSNTYESANFSSNGPLEGVLLDAEALLDLEATSSERRRPTMPSRGRSFLATEIRRSLEESVHASSTPSSPGPARDTDERSSESSNESWQQVIAPDEGRSRTTSSQVPTQARIDEVTPATATDSHDAITAAYPERFPAVFHSDDDGSSEDGESRASSVASDHVFTQDSAEQIAEPPAPSPITTGSHLHPTANQTTQAQEARHGVVQQIFFWLWGDVAPETDAPVAEPGPDDEQVIGDVGAEAPFVPFDQAQPINRARQAEGAAQDAEVAEAAAEAGIDINDPDAIDDAEDLEGILELIGMQGPITALFQNALFSALLITSTIIIAVLVPYIWGKIVLLFLGRPGPLLLFPLRILSSVADLLIDVALFVFGCCLYWLSHLLRILLGPLAVSDRIILFQSKLGDISSNSMSVTVNAAKRFVDCFEVSAEILDTAALWRVSVHSLAALRQIEGQFHALTQYMTAAVTSCYTIVSSITTKEQLYNVSKQVPILLQSSLGSVVDRAMETAKTLWKSKAFTVTLGSNGPNIVIDSSLEYWSSTDRSIATLAGYTSIAVLGAVYLRRRSATSQNTWPVEAHIVEFLQQAGGVLKVILIISIEMLAFPLYCGLLLDIALLPLYGNTLWSRYEFTMSSPWTSGFVHWFIGTCYMFHFALFVSMCRKIIRSGVLYFIRDPDDPTFHPVRDVLERNVTTQLRKIAFSALVYGGLVILCLGGVVWGLDYILPGVFPIHWSSHTPSLEFPLDLLFFNILTPLVIRAVKPSDTLQAMYDWWFRRCARLLRLTDFLFGKQHPDETGHHVRRTWASWFFREKGDVDKQVIGEDRRLLAHDRGTDVYFIFDGKYVRAPASDQVRIPKGQAVFVEVDHLNHRVDGKPEYQGIHARDSEMVAVVYIPPFFRVRIALLVFLLWLFAAITGVSVTVGPLLVGRKFFSTIIGSPLNDIYAFTLALYVMGGVGYGLYYIRGTLLNLVRTAPQALFSQAVFAVRDRLVGAIRITYVYTFLVLLLPLLVASLLELYILLPLHAYIDSRNTRIVHLVQDWTLGFLYAHIIYRLLFANPRSIASRALQAVMRNGYFNPDARLATRYFIIPIAMVFLVAAIGPAILARGANTLYFSSDEEEQNLVKRQMYRFIYPALLGIGMTFWLAAKAGNVIKRWRSLVRDEVYLVGERLHNFGDTKRLAITNGPVGR